MDYEKAYKEALERAKELKNKLEKSCSLATPTEIVSIFPELKESDNKRISKELICRIKDAWNCGRFTVHVKRAQIDEWIAWLEKQGEQNPAWSEEDGTVLNNLIDALANDRIGNNRDEYVAWLKSLKERCTCKPNVEQLTAFAQHLQKRGAFRDDLCMDFEHEAQSFIELQNNKKL